jgi:hypothetical protein
MPQWHFKCVYKKDVAIRIRDLEQRFCAVSLILKRLVNSSEDVRGYFHQRVYNGNKCLDVFKGETMRTVLFIVFLRQCLYRCIGLRFRNLVFIQNVFYELESIWSQRVTVLPENLSRIQARDTPGTLI